MKTISALIVGSCLVLMAGCATTARNQSDVALEHHLQSELKNYGDLAANEPHVRFQAQDGVVTMTGYVRNERDRAMLDSMVRNTGGVVAVNDQLGVQYPPTGAATGYPSPSPAPVYTNPPEVITPGAPVIAPGTTVVPGQYPNPQVHAASAADQAIASNVGQRLLQDGVSPLWLEDVNITVKGTAAYVLGTYTSEPEHQAIISSVRHAPGVSVVYDEMTPRR